MHVASLPPSNVSQLTTPVISETLAEAWLLGIRPPIAEETDVWNHIATALGIEVHELRARFTAREETGFLDLVFAGPIQCPQHAADVFDSGIIAGPMTNTCGTCACHTASCNSGQCGTKTCGSCLC